MLLQTNLYTHNGKYCNHEVHILLIPNHSLPSLPMHALQCNIGKCSGHKMWNIHSSQLYCHNADTKYFCAYIDISHQLRRTPGSLNVNMCFVWNIQELRTPNIYEQSYIALCMLTDWFYVSDLRTCYLINRIKVVQVIHVQSTNHISLMHGS